MPRRQLWTKRDLGNNKKKRKLIKREMQQEQDVVNAKEPKKLLKLQNGKNRRSVMQSHLLQAVATSEETKSFLKNNVKK